jgi:protein SCO1/2
MFRFAKTKWHWACSLAAAIGFAAASFGCRSAAPLPSYGRVPEFQLTAQNSQPFDSRVLSGKIWVADFIFTNCPGPCPRMTSQMKQVLRATEDSPKVRFVSISVDPKRDTPDVLASYAQKFHADTSRWSFLTGPRDTIQHLSRNVFMLGDVDDTLQHSTRFVLVDGAANIRGFYDTSDPGSVPRLIGDIKSLLKQSA